MFVRHMLASSGRISGFSLGHGARFGGGSSVSPVAPIQTAARCLPVLYHLRFCKGAVPEPIDVFSSANTLSVLLGPSTFETEWRSGADYRRAVVYRDQVSVFSAFRQHTFRTSGESHALNWQVPSTCLERYVERELE